jgi:hypothetical protein
MVSTPTAKATVVVQGELADFTEPMAMESKPLPESLAAALTRTLAVPLGTLVSEEGERIFNVGAVVSRPTTWNVVREVAK